MIVERFTAQLLAGPPAGRPEDVAERLLAVQGQDSRGVRLAVRARTSGLTVADVDRALTSDRSLLITWVNRGTLHMMRSEDYPWLHALTTPPLLRGNERRLGQEGVSPEAADRAVAVIERSLSDGPLTRGQLRNRVDAAGVRTQGQALVHLLVLASLRGMIVRGPMIGGEHAYVLVRDWLGEPGPVDRDQALAELARRYLAGHGPADDRDLAQWAGLPLRDARAGLKAIGNELDQRGDGLVELAGRPRLTASYLPPPRLLGAFDPLLLGWRSRAPIVGAAKELVTVNGLFRPFALVEGRAVATWSLPRGGVVLAPFAPLSPETAAALEAEVGDVLRFLSEN
ncbi:MAG: winged helix DNA-binding domain-containing protein [Pseudonocardiales bacterium]